MIQAVRCDRPSFRTVRFTDGINVVLADRTKESTKKDTRNGLGKSTLIQIIHFGLGGTPSKAGLLAKPLSGWTFTLDLLLQGKPISVSRNTESRGRVSIEGDTSSWPIEPERSPRTGTREMRVGDWNLVLGHLMFGLATHGPEADLQPSFRGLIPYFARQGRDAFSTPFETHRKQNDADVQLFNSFLLGLEWRYAREWQELKEQQKTLDHLRKAARSGLIGETLGTLGELEAVHVRLDADLRRQDEQLRTFRVHPEYREIEDRVNALTAEIHEMENENVSDRSLLEFYRQSTAEEVPPSPDRVLRMYEQARVAFPDTVRRRFEEVAEFHATLITNRRRFIQSEMEQIERRVANRQRMVAEKSNARASEMQVLQTHGALAEYTLLQDAHTAKMSELGDVMRRIEAVRTLQDRQSTLTIEEQLLLQRARHDLAERHEPVSRAVAAFNAYSEALYRAPGRLAIDIGKKGFRFNVEIERSGSQGIGNMKVFCYDLTLAHLWSGRSASPSFLVHDSTIFDGVDERQIALALELAAGEAQTRDFQYICALNSDTVPWDEFREGFDLNDSIRLRLTDATDEGCLLGIRY